MKVTLKRKNNAYHFQGFGKNNIPVNIDNGPEGASPMELLLMSVGACSAVDIVSILNKQKQHIVSYTVEVSGDRKEFQQAKPFKSMHVRINLEGDINLKKAQKAADLSFQKYCSVSLTLEPQVPITYEISVTSTLAD